MNMNRRYETVTIVGVGLLGGSLGLALKSQDAAGVVRGVGHRAVTLNKALAVGAIDEAFHDPKEAADGADLIVICTPAGLVKPMMDAMRPVVGKHALVTDVASTKAAICQHARVTWGKPLRFVGSHPMAGSEKFGPEYADPHLYDDRYVIVTPDDESDPEAIEGVCELWRQVGARVVAMDADTHDALVARTSHIPHILSTVIAHLVKGNKNVQPVVGSGFRDMTRVADGRPEIWRDICLTNRDAVAAGLDEVIRQLEGVRGAVLEGNGDHLQQFFHDGRVARKEVLE